jgi:hypothetical protein
VSKGKTIAIYESCLRFYDCYLKGKVGWDMPYEIKLKRIYEPSDTGDGKRILVDRLWPRGVKKEQARLDEWMKGIAPSPELRILGS